MIFEIKNCNLPEEDKVDLEEILNNEDHEFVKQYLKETKVNTSIKNLPTLQICEDYANGMSVGSIAKKYDCSVASVRNHLNKGGYEYSHSQQKYIMKGQSTVEASYERLYNAINVKNAKKNFGLQRKVINWLMDLNTETVTLTVEQVANKFNVPVDSASGVLSEILKKNIFKDSERVGKGVYKFSKNSQNTIFDNIFENSVENSVVIPVVQTSHVESDKDSYKDDFEKVISLVSLAKDIGIDKLMKVAHLAKDMGIDNLIDKANDLRNLMNHKA